MGLLDESPGSAARALRYYREQQAKDEELLRTAARQGVFPAYELPCPYCYMEFTHQRDGIGGRAGLHCSDYCASRAESIRRAGEPEIPDDQEWEDCTLTELL